MSHLAITLGFATSILTRLRGAAHRALSRRRLGARLVLAYGGFYLLVLLASVVVLAPALSSIVIHQARTEVEAAGVLLDRLWRVRGDELRRSAELASLDFGFREAIATRDTVTIASALDNVRIRLEVPSAHFLPLEGGAIRAGDGRDPNQASELFDVVDASEATAGVISIDGLNYHGAFAPVMAPDFRGWFLLLEPLDTRQLHASAELANLPIVLDIAATENAVREPRVSWDSNWSLTVSRPMAAIGGSEQGGHALMVSYPLVHALAPYWQPFGLIALVALVGTAAFLWACQFLAGMITTPIAALTDAARRLEQGEDVRVDATSEDEIGELSRVFNSMGAEIKSREQELRLLLEEESNLREQAEAASRAKSEFLSNVNHELRTPLNAIINFGEIIKESTALGAPGDVDADADRILGAARHLLRLVNATLDFTKIEANKIVVEPTSFRVANLVDEVVAAMRPTAEANKVRVTVAIDGDLHACADELRIRQCLYNLVGNALKFSRGGAVQISASLEPAGARDDLVFTIADTGIGMTPEQLTRVFRPFEQGDGSTTRTYGGTGLGLSIVHGLACALGGEVTATSTLGEGSTFTLRVPSLEEDLQAGQRMFA